MSAFAEDKTLALIDKNAVWTFLLHLSRSSSVVSIRIFLSVFTDKIGPGSSISLVIFDSKVEAHLHP